MPTNGFALCTEHPLYASVDERGTKQYVNGYFLYKLKRAVHASVPEAFEQWLHAPDIYGLRDCRSQLQRPNQRGGLSPGLQETLDN